MSVAKIISASLPFSVILSGWLESPSANMHLSRGQRLHDLGPAARARRSPGVLTPSSSKNFFCAATRCWP